MTPTELQKARELCDGFRGRFFYDAERGDLAYIAKDCDGRVCDCERKTNSDGDQDCSVCIGDMDHGEDTGEPIAKMLNLVPALLSEVSRLRGLLREACWIGGDYVKAIRRIPQTVDIHDYDDAQLDRLSAIAKEAGIDE